jgi:probable HAF family extracellular repeat protein
MLPLQVGDPVVSGSLRRAPSSSPENGEPKLTTTEGRKEEAMKYEKLLCSTGTTLAVLLAVLAIGPPLAAQEHKPKHHQYKLIDIGTLGGPASYYSAAGDGSQILNDRGTVAGWGDTPAPDPYAPNCIDDDCFLARAFRWQNGVLTDLGALPGGFNSAVNGINARGWIAGFSQNGVIDPVTNLPATHAVLWKNRKPIDLGTLGGYVSNAVYVNDGGQVVGYATLNTDPDPFSFLGTSLHAFLWQDGQMRDLGTLGGPDSIASNGGINQQNGLVAGASFINSIPNGTGIPTLDPFLWKNGTMTDLGTLGGTIGFASLANNRGQVAGQSNLAGDLTMHPFLWDDGVLTDLGTLGGDNGTANWLNDAGAVVGFADLPGSQTFGAFLWKEGVMRYLGTIGSDPCSKARAINSHGQIVGSTSDCTFALHAFLWEKGGPMVDLNQLVQSNSGFQVLIAHNINERGEIAGTGVPAGCDKKNVDTCGHVFLMIPCDENHRGVCADNSLIEAATPQTAALTGERPTTMKQGSESPVRPIDQFRNQLMRRDRSADGAKPSK